MLDQPSVQGTLPDILPARKKRGSGFDAAPERNSKRTKPAEKTWLIMSSSTETMSTEGVKRDRYIGTSKKSRVELPVLEIKQSLVPHGGLGVFAKDRISKNTWLTEYGGEVIDVKEAKRRRKLGEDTHIRSAGYQDICIDSRVRSIWTMDYYIEHHMAGGFFNDAKNSGRTYNCTYVTKDTPGYLPPYEGAPWVSKRVFLRATRDIQAGEELLVCYGPTYHGIHL